MKTLKHNYIHKCIYIYDKQTIYKLHTPRIPRRRKMAMEEFNIYNLESRDKTYVKNNNQKKKKWQRMNITQCPGPFLLGPEASMNEKLSFEPRLLELLEETKDVTPSFLNSLD